MVFECTSVNSEIEVNYCNVVEDIEKHKALSKVERTKHFGSHYSGPEFNTLDERLKTGLQDYLKSFGITEELAVFIEHVSLDKEQRLYMKWLKTLEKFL